MLTDPFYAANPCYSGTSTGVVEFRDDNDTVELLLDIKKTLQQAGWSVTGSGPSKGFALRPVGALPTAVAPVPPRPPEQAPESACDEPQSPWMTAALAGLLYVAYNPHTTIPPLCGAGTWFAMGDSPLGTAANMAGKMTIGSAWNVSATELTEDGLDVKYTLTSKMAFESDMDGHFGIGAGSETSTGGYYTLQSQPMPGGGFLGVKIQTAAVWHLGGFINIDEGAVLGQIVGYITVKASSGGEYGQPVYPGASYRMCANNFQFALWRDAPGRDGVRLLASLLKMDKNHEFMENPVLVIGSETDQTADYHQLTTKVHWEESLATGYINHMEMLGWRTQEPASVIRTPTMVFRGLRNMAMLTLSHTGFAEAPYVALADSPNLAVASQVAGRPWDMLLVNDISAGEMAPDFSDSMIFDSRKWKLFATSGRPGDLYGSLWIKEEKG